MEERLRDAAAFAVRCGEACTPALMEPLAKVARSLRSVRRPAPGRDVRHESAGCRGRCPISARRSRLMIPGMPATSDAVELDTPVLGNRRWRARPSRRAPVLARGPAASGAGRGHRARRGARRDLPGAARGCEPPRGGDAGGRAGHRQDAPAARRHGPRLGERVHLCRHHRRRGDPGTIPRGAESVRLERDPRHGGGNAGGGGGPAGGGGHLRA